MWALYYFLIGTSYVLINVFIRKLHRNVTFGGELLGLVWLMLWPVCVTALIIEKVGILTKNKCV